METLNFGHGYETVSLTPGYEIKADMLIDGTEKYLYVMSVQKVRTSNILWNHLL